MGEPSDERVREVGIAADDLLRGAIDAHAHFGPDAHVGRCTDALALVRACQEVGLRAVVLKSHEQPTPLVAYTVAQCVPEVSVFGSVCLNDEIGGINPSAVDAAARIGAKVVWFPTASAAADRLHRKGGTGGITILDGSQQRISSVTGEVLEIARQHDLVVASGHLSPRESLHLFREAAAMGLHRLVATHVSTSSRWFGLTIDDQRAFTATGALLEHCVNVFSPLMLGLRPADMIEMIRSVGAEHCILSSDLGISNQPMPPTGLRAGLVQLLVAGLSEREAELLVKRNPGELLGLD